MEIEKVIRRTVINIGEEATVEITEAFMDQIKYLCSEINNVEWSGYVFFSTKGTPKDLSKFKIIPYYIHPMDKGTAGATEFDDDGSLVDLYEKMPELDPFEDTKYKYGKIHSHNHMDVFHSSTDMQDLQDQSGQYEYYFSLIVNNRMDLEAKASFVAELPAQLIKPHKFNGAKDWKLGKEEVLGVIDFDIDVADSIISIPKHFQDRVTKIKEPKKYVHTPAHNWTRPNTDNEMPSLKEFYAEMLENQEEEEEDIADQVNETVDEIRYGLGKDLINRWIANRLNLNMSNTPGLVAFQLNKLSYVALNVIETPIIEWFDKLFPAQKQNIVLYITQIPTTETNEKLDTILEFIWNHVKAEDVV